ncbi:MAG: Wzz/FepE/Etk N-terminal domain-containing protein [Lachnospiraceae bacterium]|nr:Wzz/FepE/Etk N-terminal domain-containing protein [Lachnospiraceae bacterium]
MANETKNKTAGNTATVNRNDVTQIDLVRLARELLKKWWLILFVSLVGAVGMGAYTVFLVTPMYQSQAMIFVLSSTTSITSLADLQVGTTLTADFVVIAKSKPVLDSVVETVEEETGTTLTRSQVSGMLSVTNDEDTRILTITATGSDPEIACAVANAAREAIAEAIADIMVSDLPTTVEYAEVSSSPVSPNLTRNVMMGFLGGFVLICAILAIGIIMNDNICTEEDLEKYFGVPTLVSIPERK